MAKRCQLMLKEIYERAKSDGDKTLVPCCQYRYDNDLLEHRETIAKPAFSSTFEQK